jgi:hypothetical protein
MRLRTGLVSSLISIVTGMMGQLARADLIVGVDGPFSVAAGQSLVIPVYVTDDGMGGPTTLSDFSLKLRIDAGVAAASNGLQFDSNMPVAYANDPGYVFFPVNAGPFIAVDPAPATVGPYQEVTITDFDATFNGVQVTGKQLIAQILLTTLPSTNGSSATPAMPLDLFTLSFDLTFSEYNGNSAFLLSSGNDGNITITSAVPEPASISMVLIGAAFILAASLRRRLPM